MQIFLRLTEPVPTVTDWSKVKELVIESPTNLPGMVELINEARTNGVKTIICLPAAREWYEERFHTAN